MESKIVITLKTSEFRNLYLEKPDGTLDTDVLLFDEKKFHELFKKYIKENIEDIFAETFFFDTIQDKICEDFDQMEDLTTFELEVTQKIKATDPFTHKDDLWEEEVKL